MILDIDFGGTANDNEDVPDWTPENSSLESILHPDPHWNGHLKRQPFPGCLDTLRLLRRNGFAPIGVVSKIKMQSLAQRKIRQWFSHHGFNEVIPDDQIRFCATWEEKLGLCIRRGTTHFVDNHLAPLAPMVGRIPNLFLFRPPDMDRNSPLWELVTEGKVVLVQSWHEFGRKVLEK